MYGAILGDIIGSPYEFDRGNKTKDFPLFSTDSEFTDDTVMTIAVADALMRLRDPDDDDAIRQDVIKSMREWGRKYPWAGYGQRFFRWLGSDEMGPYGSYGNGSAMRVSAAGWLYPTLDTTRRVARSTAEATHNHPEGIKGAETTAAAIFLARTGATKAEIKEYIVDEFGYDLSRTCDEIRPGYRHIESCQQTVPEAITAFLEGNGFEDVIRTAVSLGGDSDTLTCIAGSIAEAYYTVPRELQRECVHRLPEEMWQLLIELHVRAGGVKDEISSGNAAFLIRGSEVGEPESPFWERLHAEGYLPWHYSKGHYDGVDWVWVNINSKRYARGVPGIMITSSIGMHAITVEEFWSIIDIYKGYDGKPILTMA